MIKNYFKIAWRNLLKNKIYSSINIVGLATGMAVALLIGLWIWDEVSFDSYHSNHSHIARLMVSDDFNGKLETFPDIAIPLGDELRTKYADQFKRVALASQGEDHILAIGDKKIMQSGMWVQPEFPAMFTLKMLKGRQDGLRDPSSILLTQSLAKTLFGNTDPIGKILKFDNKENVKVSGVYEDLPYNTTLYDTKYLLAWNKYIAYNDLQKFQTIWWNNSFRLFVQINEHANFDKITAKIKNTYQPHLTGTKQTIQLHPMDKWHLYSEFKNGKVVGGRIQFVWLFGIIGVFVLLLACINFMNLSTARSEKRAKEVGIRKAIGSLRSQLIGQFLSESVLMSGLALFISLVFVQVSLSFFNSVADKQMSIPWGNIYFWLMLIGFTLFTGFISGSYPAFYLSGFEPIKVLKGTFSMGRFASIPRKILVVLQFTVSIALIIGTIIVFRQIQFAKNRPVGYSREGLITMIINTPELYGHYEALRNDLIQTGAVENMTESSSPTTTVWNHYGDLSWPGKDPKQNVSFGMVSVTYDYGKTVGWQIKEGRDFSRDFPTDSGAFILNETAANLIGIKNPVGQIIKWEGKDRVVTGVVKNLIMESPFATAKPTIFFLQYDWTNYIILRVKPTMPMREALAKIEPVFRKYNPGGPFDYQFTDEVYAKKFSDEERIGNLATVFAILAIFISCLGLFGLASFVAEQRTKEIGVRKVLGASVFDLWKMLSKDFVVLVVISSLIAIPIAWHFLNQWLQDYEYRTSVSWWIFIVAGIGALAITLLTVSYQAIKAALMNPVKSLRTE